MSYELIMGFIFHFYEPAEFSIHISTPPHTFCPPRVWEERNFPEKVVFYERRDSDSEVSG